LRSPYPASVVALALPDIIRADELPPVIIRNHLTFQQNALTFG
jgi:hypothetical protein